jgi:hypothetical protein
MKLDVSLQVVLKGVDLVASTAYLTLVDKMGYADKLLSLIRLNSYAFAVDCEDAEKTLATLRRTLSVRTIFYNRNKHNYFLRCSWDGGEHSEGFPPEGVYRRLGAEAAGRVNERRGKELDSQAGGGRVILTHAPVFRSEVLVEDTDSSARFALARRLESELATAPVVVSEMGTRWYMALQISSEAQAEAVTREIVVTKKRDRGLLLNPNYQ